MPQAETQISAPPKWRTRLQAFATMAAWVVAVFLSAGRLNWTRGWICVIAYLSSMSLAGVLVRLKNAQLLAARARFNRKDTKRFDKVLLSLYLPLTFVQPVLAGLDVVRFRWSAMPLWTLFLGLALFAVAITLITWVMLVNPHAESTVRIQTDRGHTTITSGPYRFVRHPMYAGAILLYPATALMFGSLWALALSGLIAALLICRTALEDRTLRQELAGYEQFTALTRYRLIPRLW